MGFFVVEIREWRLILRNLDCFGIGECGLGFKVDFRPMLLISKRRKRE